MLTLPPPTSCGVAKALKVQAKAVVEPGNDARAGQRQRHREKDADRAGAEAFGRLFVRGVDMGDGGGQHHDHDRQRDMDERDGHAGHREQKLDRLRDDAKLHQHGVDEAVIAEHHDPGIGPHHLAEEQGRHGRDQDKGFDRQACRANQRIGERIAEDQAQDRRQQAQPYGVDEHPGVERAHHPGEIGERQTADIERSGDMRTHAVLQDREHRHGKDGCRDHGRGREQLEKGPVRSWPRFRFRLIQRICRPTQTKSRAR